MAEGLIERGTTAKSRAVKNAQIVREAEEEAERQEEAALKAAQKSTGLRSAAPSRSGQATQKAQKPGVHALLGFSEALASAFEWQGPF